MHKRLLFFDILRIAAITVIVAIHILQVIAPGTYGQTVFHIFSTNPAIIAVSVIILVSGAMLEYAHPHLKTFDSIAEFYIKRLSRMYPAYWMSLIIGIAVITPFILTRMMPLGIFLEFTGFYAFSGFTRAPINQMGSFIGLMICLYLMFPLVSAAIRRYPYQTLLAIGITEIYLRWAINTWHIVVLNLNVGAGARWFPLCNLLEFALGIYIIQQGLYPKWEHQSEPVAFLAEFTFYVFLVHTVGALLDMAQDSLPVYLIVMLMLSWMLMLADQEIQKKTKPLFFPT